MEDYVVVNNDVPYVYAATGDGAIAGPTGPRGLQGSTGPRGNTVLHGTGAPTMSVGLLGDFFIDTAAMNLYGPKSTTSWGTPKTLVGPRGPQGIQGIQGIQGPAGTVANIPYGGSGSSTQVARADHNHDNTLETIVASTQAYGGKTVPAGSKLIRQMGTYAGNTDGGGVIFVPFPMGFPNGVITILVSPGAASGGLISPVIIGGQTNQSGVAVSGGAANAAVRVNYMAIGW